MQVIDYILILVDFFRFLIHNWKKIILISTKLSQIQIKHVKDKEKNEKFEIFFFTLLRTMSVKNVAHLKCFSFRILFIFFWIDRKKKNVKNTNFNLNFLLSFIHRFKKKSKKLKLNISFSTKNEIGRYSLRWRAFKS